MPDFLKDLFGWIAIWVGYFFTFLGDFVIANHTYFVPVCSSVGALSYAYYNIRRAHKKGGEDDN